MLCESVLATFGNIIRQRIGVCMECCWCVRSCTFNIYTVVEVDDEKRNETKRNETEWMDIVVFKYVCVCLCLGCCYTEKLQYSHTGRGNCLIGIIGMVITGMVVMVVV